MKHLYVVTVELDEPSIYYTEMTERQAAAARKALGRISRVEKIREAAGFNKFKDLMDMFKDLAK